MLTKKLKRADGSSIIEEFCFILLLGLILAAPWPYGAVTPAGLLRLQILAFLTAIGATFVARRSIGLAMVPIVLTAAIAVVGAVQLIPLDASTLGRISPTTASIYRETNSILSLFGRPAATPRLSIAPTETVRASLAIMAYLACFAAAALLLRTREKRRIAVIVLVVACIIQVGYGATQTEIDRMGGTFINPNHLAGYCEIGLCAAFALIWTEIVTGRRRVSFRADSPAALEQRMIPMAWRVVAWVIIAVGIALSKSRMGITAASLTVIILLLASAAHRRTSRWTVVATAASLLAVALVLVSAITRELPLVRFLMADPRDPESDVRFRLWQLSIDTWREFPLLGSGLGTFREAFRRTQPVDFPGLYEQAHNDSLQLLVTGGWVSLALAAAAVGFMLILLVGGWWKQQHREEAAIALAAAAALLSLLIHGIAEFNFSIPAIPATLFLFLGCGWAAARDERERSRSAPPTVTTIPTEPA